MTRGPAGFTCALLLALAQSPARSETAQPLHELGFEQLMDMEVTTASRKEQPLSQTAAAVSVITREDIRRSVSAPRDPDAYSGQHFPGYPGPRTRDSSGRHC